MILWRKSRGARNFMGNRKDTDSQCHEGQRLHGPQWPKPEALLPPHLMSLCPRNSSAPPQHHISGRKRRREDSSHKPRVGTIRKTFCQEQRHPPCQHHSTSPNVERACGARADTGRNHTPTQNVWSRSSSASQPVPPQPRSGKARGAHVRQRKNARTGCYNNAAPRARDSLLSSNTSKHTAKPSPETLWRADCRLASCSPSLHADEEEGEAGPPSSKSVRVAEEGRIARVFKAQNKTAV